MMKTKKSGLLVILALALVLALSCGAWAASAKIDADSIDKLNESGDVSASGNSVYGLWARNNGSIVYTGGTVTTSGDTGIGVYALESGVIQGSGKVITSGIRARGLYANKKASITWTGDIETNDANAHGAWALQSSSLDVTGNIVTSDGSAHGFRVESMSYGKLTGNVTTHGDAAYPVSATNSISADKQTILIYSGDVAAYGVNLNVVAADGYVDMRVTGNFTAYGAGTAALGAGNGAVVTMTNGTITADADDDSAYSMHLNANGTINLVNVAAAGDNLLKTNSNTIDGDATSTLNATDCTLEGDVIHRAGNDGEILTMNVIGSEWSGAVERSGDIGAIDVTLEGSTWNVTGDTNTNGKVTADSDSNIDFRGTDDTITVAIDSLEGDPALNIKIDDTLVIKNSNGTITDISSSNPDVIEIVIDPVTKEITIISKGDGDTEITYTYIDGAGDEQTKTIGVVSGAGSDPTGGGGGSSNCNSGVGAAMFALLGLAFVYKKK